MHRDGLPRCATRVGIAQGARRATGVFPTRAPRLPPVALPDFEAGHGKKSSIELRRRQLVQAVRCGQSLRGAATQLRFSVGSAAYWVERARGKRIDRVDFANRSVAADANLTRGAGLD